MCIEVALEAGVTDISREVMQLEGVDVTGHLQQLELPQGSLSTYRTISESVYLRGSLI